VMRRTVSSKASTWYGSDRPKVRPPFFYLSSWFALGYLVDDLQEDGGLTSFVSRSLGPDSLPNLVWPTNLLVFRCSGLKPTIL
jgi:hypothetical protein